MKCTSHYSNSTVFGQNRGWNLFLNINPNFTPLNHFRRRWLSSKSRSGQGIPGSPADKRGVQCCDSLVRVQPVQLLCPHFKCVLFWLRWEKTPSFSNSRSLCFLVGRKRLIHLKYPLDNFPEYKLASPLFSKPYFRSDWRGIVDFDLGTWNIATKAHCFTNTPYLWCTPCHSQNLILSPEPIRPVHSLSTQGADK